MTHMMHIAQLLRCELLQLTEWPHCLPRCGRLVVTGLQRMCDVLWLLLSLHRQSITHTDVFCGVC